MLLRTSKISATMWVGLAGSVGAGTAAFAGLYPQLDDGKLRLLLAAIAAFLGGPLAAWASRARSWGHVTGRLLGVAAVLGIAATVPPAIALLGFAASPLAVLYGVLIFGVVLGAPTGMSYGVPLAIIASIGRRHAADESHTGTDRAQRAAGIFMIVIGTFSAGVAPRLNTEWTLPFVVSLVVVASGIVIAVRAQLRVRERAGFVWRVTSGLEPGFRLRAIDPHDDLGSLPRLAGGEMVIEQVSGSTAYRSTALGTPVAVVDPSALL
jgi:hypothetical protein